MRAHKKSTTAIETGEFYGDAAVRLFALDHPQRAPGVREQGEPGSNELYGWPLQRGELLDTTQADSTAHQGYPIPVDLVRANLPSESASQVGGATISGDSVTGEAVGRPESTGRPGGGTVRSGDQVEALS